MRSQDSFVIGDNFIIRSEIYLKFKKTLFHFKCSKIKRSHKRSQFINHSEFIKGNLIKKPKKK